MNYSIPFPTWAKRRDDSWIYVGWTPRQSHSFNDRIKYALRSDHGEKREADIYFQGATYFCREQTMKIGRFNLETTAYGHGFRSVFRFIDRNLWFGETFLTRKEALAQGIIDLEEEFQECLNDLKPKYQTKPKPIDAVQWFPGMKIERLHRLLCSGQFIEPGDWIVDGKVVTNEDFEQDYEAVT